MALRAFRGTFLVAIDNDELDEPKKRLPSLKAVKKWLNEAMILDVDLEGAGNSLGFQSCELVTDSLEELSPDEVNKLYRRA